MSAMQNEQWILLMEFRYISLHHLKINKKASGRYKDLNDLENLT